MRSWNLPTHILQNLNLHTCEDGSILCLSSVNFSEGLKPAAIITDPCAIKQRVFFGLSLWTSYTTKPKAGGQRPEDRWKDAVRGMERDQNGVLRDLSSSSKAHCPQPKLETLKKGNFLSDWSVGFIYCTEILWKMSYVLGGCKKWTVSTLGFLHPMWLKV